jgi:plastocyanin
VTASTQSHKFKPETSVTPIVVIFVLLKVKTSMSTENMPQKKSNTGWYIAAVIIVIVIIVVGVIAYQYTRPGSNLSPSPSATETPSPSGSVTTMTIYAGEPSASSFGFGTSASNIQSNPGPQLTFKVGQTYTVTLVNQGASPHGWEIVSTKAVGTPMFGAGIGVTSYVAAGQSESVTFTPTQSGNFFYVCTVAGHIALGMWGNVLVNP